jgi:hypothetical protein
MTHQPPIDRVRETEDQARDTFDDARETFAEKEAKLRREAPQSPPEPETEGDFKERMQEKLKESGENNKESP